MKLRESADFVAFYDKIKSQPMSFSLAYKLSKIYHQATEDHNFYKEKITEILRKYGDLDENGELIFIDGGVKMNPNKQQACLDEINELGNTESAMKIEPISIEELDTLSLTPQDLEGVLSFFN